MARVIGQLVVVHLGDVVAAEEIAAGGRPVEAAQQVEQRALAGARRAHDRDVVALGHVERHAAERVHRLARKDVVLAQIANRGGERGDGEATYHGNRAVTPRQRRRRNRVPASADAASAGFGRLFVLAVVASAVGPAAGAGQRRAVCCFALRRQLGQLHLVEEQPRRHRHHARPP